MSEPGIKQLGTTPKAGGAMHAPRKSHGMLFFFFGVVLPLAAVIFECNFHFCAKHFFDPFPSTNHIVLFLLIPLSNYLAWLSSRMDLSRHYAFMALISGMALGIGCLYTLMFLPLTGLSCLFVLALGFGLLGLSPLLSLPCSWLTGKTVCSLASRKATYFDPHQVEHIGHLIILVMVVAVELPSTLTRINLNLAASPGTARQGVQWLRHYGNREVMLRACYERSGRATDVLGTLYECSHPLNINDARAIFYRVTGKPFNSVPIPEAARATIQHAGLIDDPAGLNAGVEDEFDLDADIAGEAVSGVARGLSVSQSKLRGTLEPDALLSNLDWSISFANSSKYDREARAKILLPPGAVVTRATLTVDNVEHDAVIMTRSTARTVYRQNVAQRKDPLLVSTCGQDRVLVQCFPVRPGSAIQVKLSMVCPLSLEEAGNTALLLPTFEERNFQAEVPNFVEMLSPQRLWAPGTELAASRAAGLPQTKTSEATNGTPVAASFQKGIAGPSADSPVAGPDMVPVSAPDAGALYTDNKVPRTVSALTDGEPAVSCSPSGGPVAVQDMTVSLRPDTTSPASRPMFQLAGKLDTAQVARLSAVIYAERNKDCHTVFCRDSFVGDGALIERQITPQHLARPKKLLIVIDGSIAMQHCLKDVVAALKTLPSSLSVTLTLVSDETMALCKEATTPGTASWQRSVETLEKFQVEGGQDDRPALLSALAAASGEPGAAVLWIHAAQPTDDSYKDLINRLLSQAHCQPLLYDMQVVAGPNELLNGIDAGSALVRVCKMGSILSDFTLLKDSWQAREQKGAEFSFYPAWQASDIPPTAAPSSSSLAQLYAYQQLLKDLQSSSVAQVDEAYRLAEQYHLVSPVSSAIVTETIPQLACNLKLPDQKEKDIFDHLANPRELVQGEFDKVTSQLNNLNSFSTTGSERSDSDAFMAEKCCRKPAAAPSSMSELASRMQTSDRRDNRSYNEPAFTLGGQGGALPGPCAAPEEQSFKQSHEEEGSLAVFRQKEKAICDTGEPLSQPKAEFAPEAAGAKALTPGPAWGTSPLLSTFFCAIAGLLTLLLFLSLRKETS